MSGLDVRDCGVIIISAMSRKALAAHRIQDRGVWLLGMPRRAKQNDIPRHRGSRPASGGCHQQTQLTNRDSGRPVATASRRTAGEPREGTWLGTNTAL